MEKKRGRAQQRRFDEFAAGVERAQKKLLAAADDLEEAMKAISRKKIPCEIVAEVGKVFWRRFSRLDEKVLDALSQATDLHAELRPEVFLDACGQAPCPRCRGVLTDGGVPCFSCEVQARRDAPG